KQWKSPSSGFTENEPDFSAWKGQRPTQRLPCLRNPTCSETTATMSVWARTLAMSSSAMPIGRGYRRPMAAGCRSFVVPAALGHLLDHVLLDRADALVRPQGGDDRGGERGDDDHERRPGRDVDELG